MASAWYMLAVILCRGILAMGRAIASILGEAQRISVSSNAFVISGRLHPRRGGHTLSLYVNFGSDPLFFDAKHRGRPQEQPSIIGFVCDWLSGQLSTKPP